MRIRRLAEPFIVRAADGLLADTEHVDKDKRIVSIVWSTGAGVMRRDPWTGRRYIEELSMDPKHVRMERMNTVAPLLDSHFAYSVRDMLGTVVPGTAAIKSGRGYCDLQYSRRPEVDGVWGDVEDGIVRAYSVGYNVYAYLEVKPADERTGQLAVLRAVDWEPAETSAVPIPADIGATQRALLHTTSDRSATVDDSDRIRRFRLARARAV